MLPFVPRVALVLAEQQVDFARIDDHILRRRAQTEAAIQPLIRRLGVLTLDMAGVVPVSLLRELEERFARSLNATASFGFRSVRQELARLRSDPVVTAAYAVPDAGEHAEAAAGGLPSVRENVRRRARQAAQRIAEEANKAASEPGLSPIEREVAIAEAARRAAHNVVLELVGETLNLGRAASAITHRRPPRFAFRSEQLDKSMCSPCGFAHGGIWEIDSADFYTNMPPAFCLGGGRCRGVYVYGDEPLQMVLRPAAA